MKIILIILVIILILIILGVFVWYLWKKKEKIMTKYNYNFTLIYPRGYYGYSDKFSQLYDDALPKLSKYKVHSEISYNKMIEYYFVGENEQSLNKTEQDALNMLKSSKYFHYEGWYNPPLFDFVT